MKQEASKLFLVVLLFPEYEVLPDLLLDVVFLLVLLVFLPVLLLQPEVTLVELVGYEDVEARSQ